MLVYATGGLSGLISVDKTDAAYIYIYIYIYARACIATCHIIFHRYQQHLSHILSQLPSWWRQWYNRFPIPREGLICLCYRIMAKKSPHGHLSGWKMHTFSRIIERQHVTHGCALNGRINANNYIYKLLCLLCMLCHMLSKTNAGHAMASSRSFSHDES